MTGPNLCFETIEIIRRPGFERGGFKLPELAAGVNVIHGPNASGKTSLGATMHRLLQPSHSEGDHDPLHESLVAQVRIEGERHRLAYESGRATCQRDGAEVDYPVLAPPDVAGRCVLALHRLIHQEDGRDLAAVIVRESAGGYDVPQAKETLGYRDRPTGKGKLLKEHQDASIKFRTAVDQQTDLFQQEQTLNELRNKRHQARDAQDQLQWLQRAEDHLEARQAAAVAQRRVEEDFEEGMAQLREDDLQRLDQLREAAGAKRRQLTQAERDLAKARDYISDSPLPELGVEPVFVDALKEQARQLRDASGNIAAAQQQVAQTAAKQEQARESLGGEVSSERAERLNRQRVQELIHFSRAAEKLRNEQSAEEALRRWLGNDSPPDDEKVDSLRRGVELLQRWLAVRPSATLPDQPLIPLIPVAISGVLAVMSLVLAAAVHLSWLLALLPAAGLAAWALWTWRGEVTPDRTLEARREFESLPLEQPADWSEEAVRAHERALARRHAATSLAREKATRWSDMTQQRAELAKGVEAAEKQGRQWAELLGMDPAADEASLVLVAESVHRYWQAAAEHTSAVAGREESQRQYDCLLQDVNARLGECGLEAAGDPSSASASVDRLDAMNRRHESARETVAGSAVADLTQEVKQFDRQIEAIYHRIGLTTADEETLRQWARRYDEYQSAAEQMRLTEREAQSTRTALAESSDHAHLLNATWEELADERQECEDLAAGLDSLTEQIVQIETRVADAKKSHDVEAALARLDACAEALREQRSQDQQAMVGGLLSDYLVRDQRDHQQLGVFRRARQLFARITHGRYRLDVDAGERPRFQAFDTDRELGVPLDHLSSGTRLQLLLAVRVAFVERQEHGLKLPLVLDETLGNSDEQRAGQMIDAAIEICRGGRQIFYLTAQHDEVAKWRRTLRDANDVEYREFNLAEVRRFSEPERAAVVDYQPPPAIEVPAPDGADWLAYGRRLADLPPLDPRGPLGGVHLWYLIDEPPVLYELLRHGINKWGQLKNLVASGAARTIPRDSDVYQRAQAAARAIAEACRLWQIGRGDPVDRAVLIESGAVSDKFIEPVARLAARCGGDAAAVIREIHSGAVKGFRQNKRDELHDFLSQNGYLDARDVLPRQGIVDKVRSAVFTDLEKDLISAQRIAHYVAMLFDTAQVDDPAPTLSP